MSCSYILALRQHNGVIITIGEGINNRRRTVLKNKAVSVIAQSIANFTILYEAYGAVQAGEVGLEILRGSYHSKTVGR